MFAKLPAQPYDQASYQDVPRLVDIRTTANLLMAARLLNSPKRGSDTHGALGQIVQGP